MEYTEAYFYMICALRMKRPDSMTILTVAEAAKYLRIHPVSLTRKTNPKSKFYDKNFPVMYVGNTRRFVKEKIDQYMAAS